MWHGSRIVCHDPTEHESVRVGYVWPLTIQSLYGREPDLAMRCFICGSDEFRVMGEIYCGKGQPMQTMEMAHGCAPARFRQVDVRPS